MHGGEPLIQIRDLRKTYGKGLLKSGFTALQGLSLDVEKGDVFGLLGPNGAGKTTLIKILMGLVPRYEGEARILGFQAGDVRSRQRIGFLPEAHRLPGYLTGRQVLLLYGMYSGRERPWLEERVGHWLERVGMTASADRKVKEYSKGMQQRIGLAQALIHEPELVFLDEPTDGVDPVGRAAVREIVSDLKKQGITVFINSHLLMEVERICDRVMILHKGRILREGTIEELTPRTGRVHFEIEPVPAELERLLAGLGAGLARVERGFELDCNDAELDQAIDRLRGARIGIRTITPRKLTLEDSFLELLRKESA